MNILTPELTLLSLEAVTNAASTDELDLNLARRTGIMINRIVGQIHYQILLTADQIRVAAQEIDVDPDNIALLGGHPSIGAGGLQLIDTSRIFRQVCHCCTSATDDLATQSTNILTVDWSHYPRNERPIFITNLRHHKEVAGNAADVADFEIMIYYQIVELSLSELGAINASRR